MRREASKLYARIDSSVSPECSKLWDGWSALGAEPGNSEPFYQPEWFKAFADSFGEKDQPVVLSIWDGDALRGVAPLARRSFFFGKIPARTYRSLSGIHSCRYDILLSEGDSKPVCEAMWEALSADRSWDVIEVEDVPAGGKFLEIMQHAQRAGFLTGVWPTRKTPYLTIPPPEAGPFDHCPTDFKSFRSRFKSKLRKLEGQGDVSFEVRTSDFGDALQDFLVLEASGWKGANGSAIASDAVATQFYTSVVEELGSRGYLRMYSLKVGTKVVAAQLGLAMNGTYYSPKVAYDESFAYFSPGQQLNNFVINDLWENGFRTYDFLGPRMWWKLMWTNKIREHQHCYIFRPTVKGRVLHALTMRGARALRTARYKMWGDPQAFVIGDRIT